MIIKLSDFVINGGVGVVSVASHVVGDEISAMISFIKISIVKLKRLTSAI